MPEHDFSLISDSCTACSLPIRAWEVPCVPSIADDAETIAEVKEIADGY